MAITPVFFTGFEHGVTPITTSGGGLASAIGTAPTVGTGQSRSAGYGLRLNGSATAVYMRSPTFTGVNSAAATFAIKFTSFPTTDTVLVWFGNNNPAPAVMFQQSTTKLNLASSNGGHSVFTNQGVFGPVLQLNQWYFVDVYLDTSATVWTLKARVNGDAATEATATPSVAAFSMTLVQFGDIIAYTADVAVDDFLMSNNKADYPIGPVVVEDMRPTADGTHNAGTNIMEDSAGNDIGAVTAWNLLDDNPMSAGATTDRVQQTAAGSGNYAEVAFSASGWHNIIGMRGYLRYQSATAVANNGATIAIDSAAQVTSIYGTTAAPADMSETSDFYKSAQIAVPSGGWDEVKAAAMKIRMGYSTDASPIPYWLAVMFEVAAFDEVPPEAADEELAQIDEYYDCCYNFDFDGWVQAPLADDVVGDTSFLFPEIPQIDDVYDFPHDYDGWVVAPLSGDAAWSPLNLPGLVAWQKADAITGKNDGDNVDTWNDSGPGAHAATWVSGGHMVYKTAIQNGLPILRFTASGSPRISYLDSAVLDAWKNAGYGYIAFAAKPNSASTKMDAVFVEDGTNGVGRLGMAFSETGHVGEYTLFGRRLDSDGAQFVSGGSVTTQFHIVIIRVEWANAKAWIYVDGQLVASSVSFQTSGNTSNTQSWSVEIGSSGGSAFFDGDFGEVVWGNQQAADTDVTNLNSYLMAKWGVTAPQADYLWPDLPQIDELFVVDENLYDGTAFNIAEVGNEDFQQMLETPQIDETYDVEYDYSGLAFFVTPDDVFPGETFGVELPQVDETYDLEHDYIGHLFYISEVGNEDFQIMLEVPVVDESYDVEYDYSGMAFNIAEVGNEDFQQMLETPQIDETYDVEHTYDGYGFFISEEGNEDFRQMLEVPQVDETYDLEYDYSGWVFFVAPDDIFTESPLVFEWPQIDEGYDVVYEFDGWAYFPTPADVVAVGQPIWDWPQIDETYDVVHDYDGYFYFPFGVWVAPEVLLHARGQDRDLITERGSQNMRSKTQDYRIGSAGDNMNLRSRKQDGSLRGDRR